MFFCDECRRKNQWPESFMKSEGRCEICKTHSVCNDVPSRLLPIPGKTMEETREIDAKIDNLFESRKD
jgi:hypothetical protein